MKRDGMNDFADDMEMALEKQIVRSVDGAGERVFDRRKGVVGRVIRDGGEERLKGRAWDGFNVLAEEAHGGLFAEGSALALKSDTGDGVCGSHLKVPVHHSGKTSPFAKSVPFLRQGKQDSFAESARKRRHPRKHGGCGVRSRVEEENCMRGGGGILFALQDCA